MEKYCSVDGGINQGKLHTNGYRYFPRGFCSTHYKKFAKENRDIIAENKKPVDSCRVNNCDVPPPYKK